MVFRTICSKALYLDQHGFECYFFILPGAEPYRSANRVAKEIKTWFGCEPKTASVVASIPDCFDVAIATAWNSVVYVAMQPTITNPWFRCFQEFASWWLGFCRAIRLTSSMSALRSFFGRHLYSCLRWF